MILDSTLRKLQVVLTTTKTTNDMPVVVDYVDMTATTTTGGTTLSTTNGTTIVDILAAPAASTQRKVNSISIYNKDTAAKTLQINYLDNATSYQIVDVTLQVDDVLGYTDTRGWYVIDINGNTKVTPLSAMTSAQLAAILTDETGDGGGFVRANNPTLSLPNANNFRSGLTSTVTAAGTTTLLVTSTYQQLFTGTTTQTVVLPDATTLVGGHSYYIHNESTGAVIVNANGGGLVNVLAAGTGAIFVCTSIATAAGTWDFEYFSIISASGKKLTNNAILTLAGTDNTTMTFPSTSASIARTDAAQTFSGIQTFTGAIAAKAGTVGAPSVYLDGDTTTGFYRAGANIIGVTVSGVDRLQVASTGIAVAGGANFTLSQNGDTANTITNSTAGTAAKASLYCISDTVISQFYAYSSVYSGTLYGTASAGFTEIRSGGVGTNGLMIGTGTNDKPIIFGSNSVEIARISSLGLGVRNSSNLAIAYNYAGITALSSSNTQVDAAAIAASIVQSDVTATQVFAHSSARTTPRYGTALGGFGEILVTGASSNGLMIGTTLNKPIIFGSNAVEVARMTASGISTAYAVLSSGTTSGIGYSTGAGGTVTQTTSRTTGVTLNKVTGAITLVSAAGSTTPQTFTVINSAVAATDNIIVNQKSGTDLNIIHVTAIAAGSFNITFWTTGGTTTEQPVFNFSIIKGVAA